MALLPNPTLPAWNMGVLAATIGPDSLFEDRHRTKQKGPPVTPVLASPPGLMQMDIHRLFPCCYPSQGQLPCPLKALQSHTASNKPHLSPGTASVLSSISAVSSFSPGNSSRTTAPHPSRHGALGCLINDQEKGKAVAERRPGPAAPEAHRALSQSGPMEADSLV